MVRYSWSIAFVCLCSFLPAKTLAQVHLAVPSSGLVVYSFTLSNMVWVCEYWQPVVRVDQPYEGGVQYWDLNGALVTGSSAGDMYFRLYTDFPADYETNPVGISTNWNAGGIGDDNVRFNVTWDGATSYVVDGSSSDVALQGRVVGDLYPNPEERWPSTNPNDKGLSKFTLSKDAEGRDVLTWEIEQVEFDNGESFLYLKVAEFTAYTPGEVSGGMGSGDVLAELQSIHSTLSAFREAFDTQLGLVNTNLAVIQFYLQSISGTVNTMNGTTFEMRDLLQDLVTAFDPTAGPPTSASEVYTSVDPILDPIDPAFASETYTGVLDGHGLSVPTWTAPLSSQPGMQFTFSMAALRAGFGYNIPDFQIGMSAEMLEELQPYVTMLHTVFLSGLIIWGMGRVWQETRVV